MSTNDHQNALTEQERREIIASFDGALAALDEIERLLEKAEQEQREAKKRTNQEKQPETE